MVYGTGERMGRQAQQDGVEQAGRQDGQARQGRDEDEEEETVDGVERRDGGCRGVGGGTEGRR